MTAASGIDQDRPRRELVAKLLLEARHGDVAIERLVRLDAKKIARLRTCGIVTTQGEAFLGPSRSGQIASHQMPFAIRSIGECEPPQVAHGWPAVARHPDREVRTLAQEAG